MEEIYELTGIDPWFLYHMRDLMISTRWNGRDQGTGSNRAGARTSSRIMLLSRPRSTGFPTVQLARSLGPARRSTWPGCAGTTGVNPVYKLVDTCAAEFEAYTPYYYSTYEWEDEVRQTSGRRR